MLKNIDDVLHDLLEHWLELKYIIDNEGLNPQIIYGQLKERKGKKRATCKLFKVRPRVCQRFFCGKESKEEHLNERQYKFELTPEEETELKKMDAKSRTEFHKWFKWRHPYVSIGG